MYTKVIKKRKKRIKNLGNSYTVSVTRENGDL